MCTLTYKWESLSVTLWNSVQLSSLLYKQQLAPRTSHHHQRSVVSKKTRQCRPSLDSKRRKTVNSRKTSRIISFWWLHLLRVYCYGLDLFIWWRSVYSLKWKNCEQILRLDLYTAEYGLHNLNRAFPFMRSAQDGGHTRLPPNSRHWQDATTIYNAEGLSISRLYVVLFLPLYFRLAIDGSGQCDVGAVVIMRVLTLICFVLALALVVVADAQKYDANYYQQCNSKAGWNAPKQSRFRSVRFQTTCATKTLDYFHSTHKGKDVFYKKE